MQFYLDAIEPVIKLSQFTVLIKILLATLLGSIVGLERELKKKPVGVKTCIIISATTCILTIVSIQAAEYYAEVSQNIRTDPMRLAAQVISGIGFLGAGVILRKNDDAISGLTTAAIIWASAGIGIASGAGFYFDAIIATVVILIAVRVSPLILRLFHSKKNYITRATINAQLTNPSAISHITDELIHDHHRIDALSIKDLPDGGVRLSIKLSLRKLATAHELYCSLKRIPDIVGLELES